MKWFRMYNEAAHDAKVQLLDGNHFKAWVNLLCLASENEDRGVLPPLKQIAYVFRCSIHEAEAMVDYLTREGLFDIDDDGKIRPHNWDARQPESDNAAARMRAKRAEQKPKPLPEQKPEPATEPEPVQPPVRNGSEHVPNVFGPDEIRLEEKRQDNPPLPPTGGSVGRSVGLDPVGEDHEGCVSLALELFGDKAASAVSRLKADIAAEITDAADRPRWDCYAAALRHADRATKGGTEVKNLHRFCSAKAREFTVAGIPPEPVTINGHARHAEPPPRRLQSSAHKFRNGAKPGVAQ